MPHLFNEDKSLFNVQNVIKTSPIGIESQSIQPHAKGLYNYYLGGVTWREEGYSPIGVIGYYFSSGIVIEGCYVSGMNLYVKYNNPTDSVVVYDGQVDVLWKKDI